MGGRGATGKFNRIDTLRALDGSTIDLSEFPLDYGSPEPLSSRERAAVDAFEQKRYKNKIEYGTLITIDGKALIEKKGGSGSVSMPSYLYARASVMSHNHPRGKGEEGMIGGTFSDADISVLGKTNIYTIRATALEGTYSMTKAAGFDSKGLLSYYKTADKQYDAVYKANIDKARNAYNTVRQAVLDGKATMADHDAAYKQYRAAESHEFNRYLVSMHNALLKGQKQYGYSYTLERRK